MGIEWLDTIYTAITIFFASIVHGIAGFGLAQFSMGILPLFRSVASASAIFSMVAVISNFQVWLSCRDEFKINDLIKPLIGLAVGMPLGIFVFNKMNEAQIKIAIGIVLLIAVILIVLNKQTSIMESTIDKMFKGKSKERNPIVPVIVGFIAGILGGAVAIPGPPMILYGTFMTSLGIWNNKRMKSLFTSFFGILMLYRVAVVLFQGGITVGILIEALIAIPAMFLGAFTGIKIFNKISGKVFSWILVFMLVLNAFILLFN